MTKMNMLLKKPRNGDLHGQSSALRSCLSVHFKMFCARSEIQRYFSVPNLSPSWVTWQLGS